MEVTIHTIAKIWLFLLVSVIEPFKGLSNIMCWSLCVFEGTLLSTPTLSYHTTKAFTFEKGSLPFYCNHVVALTPQVSHQLTTCDRDGYIFPCHDSSKK